MKKFNQFIVESKNTHMEHLDDLIFNEGVAGTRKAINFLQDLRDMLAGSTSGAISTTVKWDGAPAVFAGIDPSDGKFFVAKKGVFNKNPKVYKTPADVKADTSGDLQKKLLIALKEFSKLGIKKGVFQGDLMFTKGDVAKETIDGQKYYTFQPNTIVYAVPVNSDLGRQIARASIGIVWHTSYSGRTFESMTAAFGKNITKNFKKSATIWQDDANFRDVSGNATFTKKETAEVTAILSNVGKLFQKIPGKLLDEFKNDEELRMRTKTFNNTFVRAGKAIEPRSHVSKLMNYIHDYYQKEIDAKKQEKTKAAWKEKQTAAMRIFTVYKKSDIENLFVLMNLLVDAKEMIINKMNQAAAMGTFLRTSSGFKVTDQEGFVAIDHMSNDAIKIVNRLEFSRANFSKDVIKGWQK